MKKVFIFCILALMPFSLVFAEKDERRGTIIATFGAGGGFGTTVETASQFSFLFDVNFINETGFTLSAANVVSVRSGALGASQNLMFGAGYYFMRERWNIGAALLASPTGLDLLFAGRINGSYFFTNNIGITGIVLYRQTVGMSWNLSMFDVFVGSSIRF